MLAYKRPVSAPVIDEISLMLKNVDLQAIRQQPVEADRDNHYLGELKLIVTTIILVKWQHSICLLKMILISSGAYTRVVYN